MCDVRMSHHTRTRVSKPLVLHSVHASVQPSTHGRERESDESEGREREGNESEGREREGNESEGREREGNESEGREREGNESEGRESEGREGEGSEGEGGQRERKAGGRSRQRNRKKPSLESRSSQHRTQLTQLQPTTHTTTTPNGDTRWRRPMAIPDTRWRADKQSSLKQPQAVPLPPPLMYAAGSSPTKNSLPTAPPVEAMDCSESHQR